MPYRRIRRDYLSKASRLNLFSSAPASRVRRTRYVLVLVVCVKVPDYNAARHRKVSRGIFDNAYIIFER